MSTRARVIVVGASAGGVPSLQALVAGLPADLDAAVFVVLHIGQYSTSNLARILERHGPLRAAHARDGEEIRRGRIYVASPDHHLLVEGSRVLVKRGPKENRFRPSIDALFRSAAYTHKEMAIGIILSGLLNDGTSGLWSIKRFGGTAIVQDPAEAAVDSMPRAALDEVEVDYVLPAAEIGSLVARLVQEPVSAAVQVPQEVSERMETEVALSRAENAFQRGILRFGERTAFTCPECHGALSMIVEGPISRFRCHTGHGFTADALLSGIAETTEEALWNATRALEEGTMLLDSMAQQLEEAGKPDDAARFRQSAREAEQRAKDLQRHATEHNLTDRSGSIERAG
ncbi:chemotaxis protein CheB [Pararoseomonas sp. SCSIO 73927]|uniref:chemotaxis protein CheB n=1 Tax=Pararoseomonas sp. SCSIO 73927 TaxID=3114537 RepID=UPI0030CF7CE9